MKSLRDFFAGLVGQLVCGFQVVQKQVSPKRPNFTSAGPGQNNRKISQLFYMMMECEAGDSVENKFPVLNSFYHLKRQWCFEDHMRVFADSRGVTVASFY